MSYECSYGTILVTISWLYSFTTFFWSYYVLQILKLQVDIYVVFLVQVVLFHSKNCTQSYRYFYEVVQKLYSLYFHNIFLFIKDHNAL